MSDTYATPNKDLAGQVRYAARDMRDRASDISGEVSRTAKDQASQLGQAAKDLASTTAVKVQDQVQTALSQQKSAGADYIGAIAQATERAAGEFAEALPQAAQYIRKASSQMENVANIVRTRDVRELVGEVEKLARSQPALFFGGAVILGFAALRFLKSSAPAPSVNSAHASNTSNTASPNRSAHGSI